MKSLIVYAHPYDGSYNHAIFDKVKALLLEKGNEVHVIDLYKDEFNPVMKGSDLALFSKGEYSDPLAESYAAHLKSSDEIVFIYPVWWYGEPAILKGFFDKVFLKGHTYAQSQKGEITPLLNIKRASVITSASLTQAELVDDFGDPISSRLINGVLGMVGINNVTWLHCGEVHDPHSREHHADALTSYFMEK